MRQQGRQYLAPFFRNPITWIGFLIPCTINSINALHAYFNYIPAINLYNSFRIMRNSIALYTAPRFEVIGLSFLLNLDVSFGVWFFAFLANVQTGFLRIIGFSIGPMQPYSPPAPPSVAHIAMGALFFLVFASFWNGREHLKEVLRKAFRGDPEIDDSNELVSYRTAIYGILLGTVCALFWLYQAGFSPLSAAVFLLCCLVAFVGLARIIAQAGLAYGVAPVAAPVLTVNILGTPLLGPAGITMLGLNFAWAADIRTFVMASAATGLKIAEVTRLECRRLFWAILGAIAVTLVGSAWMVVTLAYIHGGINLGGWGFRGLTNYTGNWIAHNIANPEPIHVWHLAFGALGAVLMGALTWLKGHFRRLPNPPHWPGIRTHLSDLADLVFGLYRLGLQGGDPQIRRTPALPAPQTLFPRDGPGAVRLSRFLDRRRVIHRRSAPLHALGRRPSRHRRQRNDPQSASPSRSDRTPTTSTRSTDSELSPHRPRRPPRPSAGSSNGPTVKPSLPRRRPPRTRRLRVAIVTTRVPRDRVPS
ncbi:MAG: DUF6785 family protein [Candidatus Latescibacterota bacterium]|nr:DUF6785 family protein [Candidatus Latescibacterota bacterium]